MQRASLPDRLGRRSSLLRRMWTDSCKCPAGCYQLGRVWGEQVPRADANMMALGVLAGQSSAPWGTWRVHVEGSTLLPEQVVTPFNWRELASNREIVIPSATWCLPGCYYPGSLTERKKPQQRLLPIADFLPLGTWLTRPGLASFLVPVGRHWQHLQSTKVYHLGSEGPIAKPLHANPELKSFCCF